MFRAFWGGFPYSSAIEGDQPAIKAGHKNLGFFHSAGAEVQGSRVSVELREIEFKVQVQKVCIYIYI